MQPAMEDKLGLQVRREIPAVIELIIPIDRWGEIQLVLVPDPIKILTVVVFLCKCLGATVEKKKPQE